MKKQLIFTTLSLCCLCACEQNTQCTPDTAAQFLLHFSRMHLFSKNDNAINTMKQSIETVKSTGYKSEFFGTPICEVVLKNTGPDVLCYVYEPESKTYINFNCPEKK